MKVVFRADASLEIGTGHIIRCLTLADALKAKGAECEFICRAHRGNLINFIRLKGYDAHVLPIVRERAGRRARVNHDYARLPRLLHRSWLGASQAQDAESCSSFLAKQQPDWLVVDHYAVDDSWQQRLKPYRRKLMVIDDLADRAHVCDLLLDQTFGRDTTDYRSLVPPDCRLLCGAKYALLRPEFATLRPYSLQRRAHPAIRELLVTLGGVDNDNATTQVLRALRVCALPSDCRITVVMGANAPWLAEVHALAKDMPWSTRVLVGVSDMARVMADSDLAVGAAGATSWERCCLGVPTIMIVMAENQRKIADELRQAGAAQVMELSSVKAHPLISPENLEPAFLQAMSAAAAAVTDGLGVARVTADIFSEFQHAN